jgi:uncharacterized glyoxalase superfamily protein PhnB
MSTEPASFSARSLAASLTVRDLQASLAWYCDVVGFAVERRMEHEGKVRSVAVRAGDVRILLNQDDGAKGLDREKGTGMSMMFTTTQSVDEIAERIRAAGGTLHSEPADMPWGVRAFRTEDPDGFRYAFSQEKP